MLQHQLLVITQLIHDRMKMCSKIKDKLYNKAQDPNVIIQLVFMKVNTFGIFYFCKKLNNKKKITKEKIYPDIRQQYSNPC